ncbi:hypothetical protein [Sorangium sp. So ce1389]|uniref:hypothetical protein n=1 Tax=Sorangium sp. So ce1389 TaxID=3133336 RepID=UPI003F5DC1B9
MSEEAGPDESMEEEELADEERSTSPACDLRSWLAGAPLLWRQSSYGAWLPNTLAAKTGNFAQQLQGGSDYVRKYAQHAGA